MCLAIPAKIERFEDDSRLAVANVLGVKRTISCDLVPHAQVGDYVLVHAGFGIEVVDETFAQETLDLIREFPELVDAQDALDEAAFAAEQAERGSQGA